MQEKLKEKIGWRERAAGKLFDVSIFHSDSLINSSVNTANVGREIVGKFGGGMCPYGGKYAEFPSQLCTYVVIYNVDEFYDFATHKIARFENSSMISFVSGGRARYLF